MRKRKPSARASSGHASAAKPAPSLCEQDGREHDVAPAPKKNGRARKSPRNHRELAKAIFAECDPITVGRELLESGSERGSSVKARVWETLVEFLLGKQPPAAGAAPGPNVRIVWDLPGPPHEAEKS